MTVPELLALITLLEDLEGPAVAAFSDLLSSIKGLPVDQQVAAIKSVNASTEAKIDAELAPAPKPAA